MSAHDFKPEMFAGLARPSECLDLTKRLVDAVAYDFLEQMEGLVRRFAAKALARNGMEALVEQALAAALRMKTMPVARQQAVLLHPTFCYWNRAMRRLTAEGVTAQAPYAAALGEFVWPEDLLSGESARGWQLQLDDRGGLRCVPYGIHVEFGRDRAGQTASLEVEGGYVHVTFDDGLLVRIPVTEILQGGDSEPATIAEHGFEIIRYERLSNTIEFTNRDPVLRVDFTWTLQRKTGVNFFGISDALFPAGLVSTPYRDALGLIAQLWPEAYAELPLVTRVIVPMDSGAGQSLAFTVSSRQGAIFLDALPPEEMVDSLLHETAHVKLRHMQVFDTLLDNFDAEEPRFAVPWRKDPRPLPGIFEGVFVFSHVAEWELRRSLAQDGSPSPRTVELLAHLGAAIELVETHGSLTAAGMAFIKSMKDWHADLSQQVTSGTIPKELKGTEASLEGSA